MTIELKIYGMATPPPLVAKSVHIEATITLNDGQQRRRDIVYAYDKLGTMVFNDGLRIAIAHGEDIPRVFAHKATISAVKSRYQAHDAFVIGVHNVGGHHTAYGYYPPDPRYPDTDLLKILIDTDELGVIYGPMVQIGFNT